MREAQRQVEVNTCAVAAIWFQAAAILSFPPHLLNRQGCRITEVENGLQAFEEAQKRAYDVVLMDCQMPIMDGYEATKLIRQYEAALGLSPVPIIALTASAVEEDRQQCLDAGMNDYLSKPYTRTGLMSVLSKWSKAPHGRAL